MQKCDFTFYWNHTFAYVFFYKYATYLQQNTFLGNISG